MNTADLDLVCDRHSSYPVAVKEALRSSDREQIGYRSCGVNAAGWRWLVCGHSVFVWITDAGSVKSRKVVELPLPTSGLPYNADKVLVYQRGRSTQPGALAVSPEGVVRHWPSIGGAFADTLLPLNSHVAHSVHLINETGPVFLLTTTSGTLYTVQGSGPRDPKAALSFRELGCCGAAAEQRTYRKRLSMAFFGAGGANSESCVQRCVLVSRDSEEMAEEDEEEEGQMEQQGRESLAVLVSSSLLSAFHLHHRNHLWAVQADALCNDMWQQHFNSPVRSRQWLVDGAAYQDGVMLLAAAENPNDRTMHFALVYVTDFDYRAPDRPAWFAHLNTQRSRELFNSCDESSFLARLQLLIPENTAQADKVSLTDGIVIAHDKFTQVVHPPDSLGSCELRLNKTLLTPQADWPMGYACDSRFCYMMLCEGGVCTLRVLPKGFDECGVEEGVLCDLIGDRVDAASASRVEGMSHWAEALRCFAQKNLMEASTHLNGVETNPRADLTHIVYRYMLETIDDAERSSARAALVDTQLANKRAVCKKAIVFIKNMKIYNKVCSGSASVVDASGVVGAASARSGASLLAEMLERLEVADALRKWQSAEPDQAETRRQALDMCAGRTARMMGRDGDADEVYFTRLSQLHLLPGALVQTVRHLLGEIKAPSAKADLLKVAGEIALQFTGAVDASRRSATSVEVPSKDTTWTQGGVATAIEQLALLTMDEMEAGEFGLNEYAKLRVVITDLSMFALSESSVRPEGHRLIEKVYNMGEPRIAVDLAERFMDFKLLVKMTLHADIGEAERKETLERYKRRFAAHNFDLYLCEYYRTHGLTQLLLGERGERVDSYLSTHDGIRWRRELQNGQYDRASRSLLGLATREAEDAWKQKMMLCLSHMAAGCAPPSESAKDVLAETADRLKLATHRDKIPESAIKLVYPDNPRRPLTALEMISLNTMDTCDEQETAEGFVRALSLISDVLRGGEEGASRLRDVWSDAIKRDGGGDRLKSPSQVEGSFFGRVLRAVLDVDGECGWKTRLLPDPSTLPTDALRKCAEKARIQVVQGVC